MTYTNKQDFMSGLRDAIGKYEIPDARDILLDFEQHFTDGAAAGETEEDVCRKLGDVEEIAKQYLSDEEFMAAAGDKSDASELAARFVKEEPAGDTASAEPQPDASGFDAGSTAEPAPQYQQTSRDAQDTQSAPQYQQPAYTGFSPSGGAITAVILVDLFVFTWALPTLASLIVSLMVIALTFAIIGIVSFFGGIAGLFMDISGLLATGFAPVSLIFLGIMMSGFAGMLVIASIGSVKGFIGICRSIINWHSRTFAGYDVFRKEED